MLNFEVDYTTRPYTLVEGARYHMPNKNEEPSTLSKIFAIIYLSPIGRLLLYAFGLSVLALLTVIITGNRFDDYYFIFGLLLLFLVLLNWVSYALELGKGNDDETKE